MNNTVKSNFSKSDTPNVVNDTDKVSGTLNVNVDSSKVR